MPTWNRLSASVEVGEAFAAIDGGADWVLLWCAGGRTTSAAPEPERQRALDLARAQTVGPTELRRLVDKAARKGRSKTVVLAEEWVENGGGRLVVFSEGGPHLLPERQVPDRR